MIRRSIPSAAALIATLVAILPAGLSHAAPGDRKILVVRGRVADALNWPIAGARISAEGPGHAAAISDDAGRFSLTIPLGTPASLARTPVRVEVSARIKGWRVATASGAGALAIEVRVVAAEDGAALAEVRASEPDVAAAVASALVQDGESVALVQAYFVGVRGGEGDRRAAVLGSPERAPLPGMTLARPAPPAAPPEQPAAPPAQPAAPPPTEAAPAPTPPSATAVTPTAPAPVSSNPPPPAEKKEKKKHHGPSERQLAKAAARERAEARRDSIRIARLMEPEPEPKPKREPPKVKEETRREPKAVEKDASRQSRRADAQTAEQTRRDSISAFNRARIQAWRDSIRTRQIVVKTPEQLRRDSIKAVERILAETRKDSVRAWHKAYTEAWRDSMRSVGKQQAPRSSPPAAGVQTADAARPAASEPRPASGAAMPSSTGQAPGGAATPPSSTAAPPSTSGESTRARTYIPEPAPAPASNDASVATPQRPAPNPPVVPPSTPSHATPNPPPSTPAPAAADPARAIPAIASPAEAATAPAPDSCACRVRGTLEIGWDRPLEERVTALITLGAFRDTVELFMGSPREFRFGPIPCGHYRIRVEARSRLRLALPANDRAAEIDCQSGRLAQTRLVLEPVQRGAIRR